MQKNTTKVLDFKPENRINSHTMKPFAAYDSSFYDGQLLRAWARKFSLVIPNETDFIISAGISGAAIASAILVHRVNLYHVNVRAGNMKGHRIVTKAVSGFPNASGNYVFVDDFADSGITATKALKKFAKLPSFENTKLIGIVLSGSMSAFQSTEKELANKFYVPVFFANKIPTIYPEK